MASTTKSHLLIIIGCCMLATLSLMFGHIAFKLGQQQKSETKVVWLSSPRVKRWATRGKALFSSHFFVRGEHPAPLLSSLSNPYDGYILTSIMALKTNINPIEFFANNDTFESLNDLDEQNPFRGTESVSKQEICACGRYGPFQGPFIKLRQDHQFNAVLVAFNEGIEITLSVYQPENMQTWMLWLFVLAQIPKDIVMQYCHHNNITPQHLVGSMPSLFNHGFTSSNSEFSNARMLIALKFASIDVRTLIEDARANYTLNEGGIDIEVIGKIDVLIVYKLLMDTVAECQVYKGRLLVGGKASGQHDKTDNIRNLLMIDPTL